MGSFLAKGSRVSGKTVDQRCPGLRFFDPSLLPGASVSSSVKPMVFVRVLLAQFFVLCLLFLWNPLRLADAGNLEYENLVFNQTSRQRRMVSLICSMWSPRRSW